MVSVQLLEPVAPVEEELLRHQTEVAYWSYYVPCAGVKCYAYEDRAAPIKPAGPREASLPEDGAG
jgi:hypothetical protein